MTRGELIAFAPSINGCSANFGALTYAVPTLNWLQGPCWEFFRARLWSENLDKWQVRWECRDFARAFACCALECWAKTVGGTDDDGLAVGEIWFLPDRRAQAMAGHAVCPAITDGGLIWLDPQNGQLWPFTPSEFASRYYLRW